MRKDADYLNIPKVFAVPLAKPMMYYPAAAMELWKEKVDEHGYEHSGGRLNIMSLPFDGEERKYYISGYAVRKKPDVRNRP